MSGPDGMSSLEASVAIEKMLNMQEKIEVLERMMEEQRLGAERDAPRERTEGTGGGGGGGTREAAAREQAASTMPTPELGAQAGMSLPSVYRPSLTQSRPSNFENIEAHFSMWRSKFEAYLSSLGCLHVSITSNPVMVGDVRVSQEELASRYSPQEIRGARLGFGLMMETMTRYAMADFRMQKAMPPSGAWKYVEDYHMQRTIDATHRLQRELVAIRMAEDGNPLLFLGRVDKVADELAMLGCGKIVEANRHIVTNLSSSYMVQSKSIPSRPSIPRFEINDIIRYAYANDTTD